MLDTALPLVASDTTVIDWTIAFIAPMIASSTRSTAQTSGYKIRFAYTARNAAVTVSTLLELDWIG
jgi:hypothetical protein